MKGDALADSTLLQNRLISKLKGGLKLTLDSCRWTERQDELLRELVDAGAPAKSICETLNRSEAELRRRGYTLAFRGNDQSERPPSDAEAALGNRLLCMRSSRKSAQQHRARLLLFGLGVRYPL